MRPKIFSVPNVLQSHMLSREAMSSASAVIGDCDGVPGQQSRCTLCKPPLRGTHSHPGQWKSELQQFPLKYTVRYPGAHVSARPVTLESDGGCMVNTKENLQNIKNKALLLCTRLWPNLERSCVCGDFDTCEAANVI